MHQRFIRSALAVLLAAASLAVVNGCASPAAEEAVDVPDADIVADVQDRLRSDDVTRRQTFSVVSDQGVVTLTGQVPAATVRARAVGIVRNAPGVKGVVDNMYH